jgi:hypothetical protein
VSAGVQAHYAKPKASLPPAPTAGPTPPSPYPAFDTLPDRRSLFLGLQYSFTKLPEPMPPRVADPRVGHFVDEVWDFTDDRNRTPRQYLVQRWRLEKKDPTATLSEPVKPIVYWIDRNVPEKYRGAVRGSILGGTGRSKIGFKDASGRDPAESADSTADARHAAVRYSPAPTRRSRSAPSAPTPDRRILDAAVAIPDSWARGDRRLVREDLNTASLWPAFDAYKSRLRPAGLHAGHRRRQAQFVDCRSAATSPVAPRPTPSCWRASKVTMHEVGHTLGLRHNFRASTIYSEAELADPAFTRVNGISGSVMEYNPWNIARRGQPQGEYQQSTLGPYDYWAIEYAYKPLDPAGEAGARPHRRARRDRSAAGVSSDQESWRARRPPASSISATIRWPTSTGASGCHASCGRGWKRSSSSPGSPTTCCAAASIRACARPRGRRSSSPSTWPASSTCATSPAPAATRSPRCRRTSSARR